MGSGERFALQNRLDELIVKEKIRKNYVPVMFFLCFILRLSAISTHNPRRFIFGGRFNRGVFCVTRVWGSYMEGLIFGILRYFRSFAAPA